jgi:hypothetical protein
MPLVAALGGARQLFGAGATFGATTGVCRIDCTWRPGERGAECPDDSFTCDAFGAVCVEACTSDVECNTTFGVTYAGELVTTIDDALGAHCNHTTGRCETAGTTGATVGTPCASSIDCAADVGVCVAGGLCAELGCPNPGTTASTCAGGAGVCLPTSATSHPSALCLLGCDVAADCAAGNTCVLFGPGLRIGTHAGYCLGVCDTDDQCAASETCTDGVGAAGAPTPGQCRPRCTGVGLVGAASGGCAATELCLADHAGATYGWCEPADRFCGDPDRRSLPAASTDCAMGWVCDELLAGVPLAHDVVGDGHCTPACATDADCAGTTCVTTGALAGLCRGACTSDADCTAPNVCDTSLGWCVEAPPPP